MSVTYKGTRDGQAYLLKEVSVADTQGIISLTQEKSTLERLDHPGVVKVFDLFQDDGYYYMVTEFVEGKSLDRLVSPFPDTFLQEDVVLDWAVQLCGIFIYLHRHDPPVIYRDLKPSNVIRDNHGRVRLVDFGIARVFKQGKQDDTQAMGSLLTASPEHYGGVQTDQRSDIYTLGATLHFLLTNGRAPRTALFRFCPVTEFNPRVSGELDRVIRKTLAFEPGERYQSMGELRKALLDCRQRPRPAAGHQVEPTRPLSLPEASSAQSVPSVLDAPSTPTVPSAPSTALVGTAALALVCLLVLVGWGLARRGSGPSHPPASVAIATPTPASGVPSAAPGFLRPPSVFDRFPTLHVRVTPRMTGRGRTWRIEANGFSLGTLPGYRRLSSPWGAAFAAAGRAGHPGTHYVLFVGYRTRLRALARLAPSLEPTTWQGLHALRMTRDVHDSGGREWICVDTLFARPAGTFDVGAYWPEGGEGVPNARAGGGH